MAESRAFAVVEARRYSMKLLGPFALSIDGEPVDLGELPRRPLVLLRLLAASPNCGGTAKR